jgi:lipopolysaccharide assembly outer membrane protein LptD (OstA)
MNLQNGYVLIYDETLKISGQSIRRYGEDFYTGDNVEYTSCLGTPPAWSLNARSMVIPVEGYAKAEDVTMETHNYPLLWIPRLPFPAKLKRQTGLLFPGVSSSSDYGFRFDVPVYVVLGRSMDWTFSPTYLSQRGLLLRNEFRYCLDYDKLGLFYLENLNDRRGGESTSNGVLDEIPRERWFFKAEQTGRSYNWDINLVSTPDYFRDIGTFYTAKSMPTVMQGDTHAFDDSNLQELISRAQWAGSYKKISASLSGQWKQSLLNDDNGNTIQQLPRLTMHMRESDIPGTPLTISSQLNSVRLYSSDYIEGFKNDAKVELAYPINFYPYFTLRPFIQEFYRDTRFTETRGAFPRSTYTELWQARGASLSTTLYSKRFGSGLYHQFIPTATWTHQSIQSGGRDPFPQFSTQFLPGDTVTRLSDLELSFANYLRDNTGNSLADLTVTSTYSHIDELWGLVETRMNLRPASWVEASFTNKSGREPKQAYATQEQSFRIAFLDDRKDILYISQDYNRTLDTNLVKIGTLLTLTKEIKVGFDTGYDYSQRKHYTSNQSIFYTSQCWALELNRKVEPANGNLVEREITWTLVLRLLGLGDFSAGI